MIADYKQRSDRDQKLIEASPVNNCCLLPYLNIELAYDGVLKNASGVLESPGIIL